MKTPFVNLSSLSALIGFSLAVSGFVRAEEAPPPTLRAAMPSSQAIERDGKNAYQSAKSDNSGKNADYIPALAQVPSDLFGIAVITVDGKLYQAGDVDHPFSIQSCSKVFTLCHVLQESGDKVILDK